MSFLTPGHKKGDFEQWIGTISYCSIHKTMNINSFIKNKIRIKINLAINLLKEIYWSPQNSLKKNFSKKDEKTSKSYGYGEGIW